ncbi:RICIN domain-containing protein [Dactylosporangium sp. CA-092794]|uniref:RICIN domain-containing protein n=1 Tax=Dactylosporangium sp. CA-092794 TaxID=3239929 RepID=UPI003D8CC4A7
MSRSLFRPVGGRPLAAVAALGLAATSAVLAGTGRPAAAAEPSAYSWSTPGTYTVTVPAGASRISLLAIGAAGYPGDRATDASLGGAGGSGSRMATVFPVGTMVQPGHVLQVVVGALGGGAARGYGAAVGAFHGGNGGNGGGASYIVDLTTGKLLLVAGGGGGGGGGGPAFVFLSGGAGGSGSAGHAGSVSAGMGGTYGLDITCGTSGLTFGTKGESAASGSTGGGGGGGGGGACGGLGGGSGDHGGNLGGGGGGGGAGGSYAALGETAFSVTTNTGDGQAQVSFLPPPAAKPVITSGGCVAAAGMPTVRFTFSATGYPAPAFSLVGAPPWLAVGDQGDGTAILYVPPTYPGSIPSGEFQFQVVATNSLGTATQDFTVSRSVPWFIEWPRHPRYLTASSDKPWSWQMPAGNCFKAASYGLKSADPDHETWLPAMNWQTGELHGTPPASAAGVHHYIVSALPADGSPVVTAPLNLVIDHTPPAVTGGALPAAVVGRAYHAQLAGTGGYEAYTWSVAPGSTPPPGLTVNYDGTVTGTPAQTGHTDLEVRLTDFDGATAGGNISIDVDPPLDASVTSLPFGVVASPYAMSLVAWGGTGRYTWSVAPGSTLPAGVTLAPDGTLAGTPAGAGLSYATLRVNDADGQAHDVDVLFIIVESLSALTAQLDPESGGEPWPVTITGGSEAPGATVIRTPDATVPDAVWTFTPLRPDQPGGTYQIANRATGLCLATDGVAGDAVYQAPCTGGRGQIWQTGSDFGGESISWVRNPASNLYLHLDSGGTIVDTQPWDGRRDESFFPVTIF